MRVSGLSQHVNNVDQTPELQHLLVAMSRKLDAICETVTEMGMRIGRLEKASASVVAAAATQDTLRDLGFVGTEKSENSERSVTADESGRL